MTESIKEKLYTRHLPEPLYIKGFVHNEGNCNYEIYLRELLNVSEFFQRKSGGEEYRKPDSEHNGQNDAQTERYELDFKLLEGPSLIEGKHLFSDVLRKIEGGVVVQSGSLREGVVTAANLDVAIRNISVDEVDSLINKVIPKPALGDRTSGNINTIIEYDLNRMFSSIAREKNIFLFRPLQFFLKPDEYNKAEKIKCLTEAVIDTYHSVVEYRKTRFYQYDTYFCCILDNEFVVLDMMNRGVICDCIPIAMCCTFIELWNKYCILY